jgi:hypothetical protein
MAGVPSVTAGTKSVAKQAELSQDELLGLLNN